MLEIRRLLRNKRGERCLGGDLETARAFDVVRESLIEGRHELLRIAGAAQVRKGDHGDAALLDDDSGVLRHEDEQGSSRCDCEPDGLLHAWSPTVLTRRQTQSPHRSWGI